MQYFGVAAIKDSTEGSSKGHLLLSSHADLELDPQCEMARTC